MFILIAALSFAQVDVPENISNTVLKNREIIWYKSRDSWSTYTIYPKYQEQSVRNHQDVNQIYPVMVSVSPGYKSPNNAAREFPWISTAGLEQSPTTKTKTFLSIPNGKKIMVYRLNEMSVDHQDMREAPGQSFHIENALASVQWKFPEDTLSGEVIYTNNIPCEVRIRRKTNDHWVSTIYRPFPTPNHLASAIKKIWPKEMPADVKNLLDHCNSVQNVKVETLGDHLESLTYVDGPTNEFLEKQGMKNESPPQPARSHVANKLFKLRAAVDTLPPINAENAAKLLKETPFVTSVEPWILEGDVAGYAPRVLTDNHIFPKNYHGAFYNETVCNTCHSTPGEQAVRHKTSLNSYGNVRGSDGVFSFIPFSEESTDSNEVPVIDPKFAKWCEWGPTQTKP